MSVTPGDQSSGWLKSSYKHLRGDLLTVNVMITHVGRHAVHVMMHYFKRPSCNHSHRVPQIKGRIIVARVEPTIRRLWIPVVRSDEDHDLLPTGDNNHGLNVSQQRIIWQAFVQLDKSSETEDANRVIGPSAHLICTRIAGCSSMCTCFLNFDCCQSGSIQQSLSVAHVVHFEKPRMHALLQP